MHFFLVSFRRTTLSRLLSSLLFFSLLALVLSLQVVYSARSAGVFSCESFDVVTSGGLVTARLEAKGYSVAPALSLVPSLVCFDSTSCGQSVNKALHVNVRQSPALL